jgi:hypothetical protein
MTTAIVHGITVDYSRDSLFDELGIKRLKESYMKDDEVSPQERFAFVSKSFGSNPDHAQRLYDYASKHCSAILLPFFLLVAAAGAYLFLAFYHISTIVQKAWSSVLQR